jgi:peptidoglycan/xylan/chitin deacetylase (PgdA/CDA1 family)
VKLLQRLRSALARRPRGPAVILMYHRVAVEPLDPWQLCVTPAGFAAQLDWLRANCRVIALRQLAAELRDGSLAPRSVAISFDDGYADNLLAAEPLLRERGLPATFFLTTATLGVPREFWWDELERMLMRPQALPETLAVRVAGEDRTFAAGRAGAACDPVRECRGVQPWKAAAGTRLAFYYRVWDSLRPLEESARRQALDQIRGQLGTPEPGESRRRTLTRSEVGQLAASPVADIGAHSVTHATFSRRTPDEQRWEMQQSRRELESMLGRGIPGFAYPYGDFGPESAELAREAGFEFACTTREGPVSSADCVHLLPRVAVVESEPRAFAAQVSGLLA